MARLAPFLAIDRSRGIAGMLGTRWEVGRENRRLREPVKTVLRITLSVIIEVDQDFP